jgi:hypothetical protein
VEMITRNKVGAVFSGAKKSRTPLTSTLPISLGEKLKKVIFPIEGFISARCKKEKTHWACSSLKCSCECHNKKGKLNV